MQIYLKKAEERISWNIVFKMANTNTIVYTTCMKWGYHLISEIEECSIVYRSEFVVKTTQTNKLKRIRLKIIDALSQTSR